MHSRTTSFNESPAAGLRTKLEPLLPIVLIGTLFGGFGQTMGFANMFNTLFHTAHDLLLNTVFYIMSICVLASAISRLLTEFGTIRLLEVLLRPLMRPIFGLPGKAALAGVMTFLSDNPAIIGLTHDKRFSRSFKAFELASLANFGTAFGMGLIVVTFMSTLNIGGESTFVPALIGLMGAVIGSLVSTRMMQKLSRPLLGEQPALTSAEDAEQDTDNAEQLSIGLRLLNGCLDGGKTGVDLGLAIIPGVLIISTIVMMLTFGPGAEGYNGAAYQGVAVLPEIAQHLSGIFYLLFGFQSPELIAFPITSLGAVGAAMSLVPPFIESGIMGGNEIAVFTAMGMCWSGYLSTHTAMLDTLGYRKLISRALMSHTLGGIIAGVSAHYLFVLIG